MFAFMFAMGLALIPNDFRRVAKAPRASIVGTLLQLVFLPLIGLFVARAFDLSPLLTAGLVVLSACPGGMFSNMYVHIAGGNTALSVTLTATATFVTLFTLPLWVGLAIGGSAAGIAGETVIEMPVIETALQLGGLTILPIVIGMAVRQTRPDFARWERRISLVCVILIVGGVIADGLGRPEPPSTEFALSVLPVACFSLLTLASGILIPALFGLSARDGVTIAVELIVKNTLLGMVLLTQATDFVAIVPIIVFAAVQTPCGILLLVGWRFLARRGYFEPTGSQELA